MTIYKRFSNPRGHRADTCLSTCPECARLKLGAQLATTRKEREQWEKLLADHLAVKWTPAQPSLIEEGR